MLCILIVKLSLLCLLVLVASRINLEFLALGHHQTVDDIDVALLLGDVDLLKL